MDAHHLAAGGVVAWVGFGLVGTLAGAGGTQNVCFAISALGLVTGGALLGVRYARAGTTTVATGFALLRARARRCSCGCDRVLAARQRKWFSEGCRLATYRRTSCSAD
ncbi:MAG: hypothetical protein ABI939_11805 [Anaerolineaceae bacterium]